MGWTKRQFIQMAFEEIGLAAYVFDYEASNVNEAGGVVGLWQLGYVEDLEGHV